MQPSQYLPFEDQAMAPAVGFTREVTGGLIRRMLFTVAGSVTNGALPSVTRAGAGALMGDIRLLQDGSTFASLLAYDAKLCTDLFFGGAGEQVDSDTASGAVNVADTLDLDWGRIFPGAGVDASNGHKAGVRIDPAPAADYSETSTTYALTWRGQAEHEGGVAVDAYSLPRLSYEVKPVEAQSSQILIDKQFEHDGFLIGFSIRQRDSSANLRVEQVDGLIKRMKVKHVRGNGSGSSDLFDGTWRQLKKITQQRFRVPSARRTFLASSTLEGLEPGFAFFPFYNPKGPAKSGRISRNDRLQIMLDSSGTAETPYTNVVPGSGDQAIVHFWFFSPAKPGSADRAQQGVVPTTRQTAQVARAAAPRGGGRRFFGARRR
jgi:hypothetical protein